MARLRTQRRKANRSARAARQKYTGRLCRTCRQYTREVTVQGRLIRICNSDNSHRVRVPRRKKAQQQFTTEPE